MMRRDRSPAARKAITHDILTTAVTPRLLLVDNTILAKDVLLANI